jgi:predicted alpha-1,2-mannosidase
MMKANQLLLLAGAMLCTLTTSYAQDGLKATPGYKEPVDYVNPNIGNISHMLVPTYPTTHLPNSMMRVFPLRHDYTTNRIGGLPLIVTHHREESSFNFYPYQGNESDIKPTTTFSYDQEKVTPYRYQEYLDEVNIAADFAPSHQSAVYSISFEKAGAPYLVFNCGRGELKASGNIISGHQELGNKTSVYIYAVTDVAPVKVGTAQHDGGVTWHGAVSSSLVVSYPADTKKIGIRYGVSFISEEQAKKNVDREIKGYDVAKVAAAGRAIWNEALGKIVVTDTKDSQPIVFYTSLYRTYERPICISEDGQYFSASDAKVHSDEGKPFYTDDWTWDTYRAAHPLRVLINPAAENNILNSYVLMSQQTGKGWMPTFPGVSGEQACMNSNHGIASIADAYAKGLRGFDLAKAYDACKASIETKSLLPWSYVPSGELDDFFKKNGYLPALKPGEKETVAHVNGWEKRQPIAVTLGTSFDEWCLSQIAQDLGKTDDASHYLKASYNYRNVFNPKTGFFHPKDKDGKFIEPLDYRIDGGPGARQYYDENNGYVYRWDVQHNIGDLVKMVGGNDKFVDALEDMFNEGYPGARWDFYATLPDHTGNVGMFSMANEPAFHIPYLYNYAGAPWRTQKRIRSLLDEWFRNDLMGIPGDEDGGGMTAFVVFSQMGFYPVTPGSPTYNIGSPVFPTVYMDLGNGKHFQINAKNASATNKYIQSATLNGKVWDKPWFNHSDIANGGSLDLVMGPVANKAWGANSPPPSAAPMP